MDIANYIKSLYKTAGQLNLYMSLCNGESGTERISKDIDKIKVLILAIEEEIYAVKP